MSGEQVHVRAHEGPTGRGMQVYSDLNAERSKACKGV